MDNQLFLSVLDDVRMNMLPKFLAWKDTFYLAGGTGLALQIGHRKSIDFDFFSERQFDTSELFRKITEVFSKESVTMVQQDANTVSVVVAGTINISFFFYPYTLIKPKIESEYMFLASIEDIACMKLSAIISRSVRKDYVDLYFILKQHSLSEYMMLAKQKYPTIDESVFLKSLVYFEDIIDEPIMFLGDNTVDFETIKQSLQNSVRSYLQ